MISESARDERTDHLDHSVDVALIGSGGEFICALDPQRLDIFEECFFELRSEFREWNFRFSRATDRLVINVGDVHHAIHLVAAQLEMPLEQIFKDVGAKISDMRPAINGRSASVDFDRARGGVSRLEFFDLARVGVKELKSHVSIAVSSRAKRGTSHKNGALACSRKSSLRLRDGSLCSP